MYNAGYALSIAISIREIAAGVRQGRELDNGADLRQSI